MSGPPVRPAAWERTQSTPEATLATLATGTELDSGADLLEDLRAWFARYIVTRSGHGYVILALWTAHAHALDAWQTTPRLLLTSALPSCGKTTVLEHLERLTPAPLFGSHATPALIARITAHGRRTILLDETDNLLNAKREGTPDLLALLNSGYRKGGTRPTLDKTRDGWIARELPTYSAVALAGIGDLPDTITSRSIVLHLDPARAGEVQYTEWLDVEAAAHNLRDRLATWTEVSVQVLASSRPELPADMHGRDREVWEPLLKVADLAGADWPVLVREAWAASRAEQVLDRADGVAHVSQQSKILSDLRSVWPEDSNFMATADLLGLLAEHDPETWGTASRFGKAISPKRLGNLLAKVGVRPDRNTERTQRGYRITDLQTTWERYLHPVDPSHPSDPSDASTWERRLLTGPDGSDGWDGSDGSPACRGGPREAELTEDLFTTSQDIEANETAVNGPTHACSGAVCAVPDCLAPHNNVLTEETS